MTSSSEKLRAIARQVLETEFLFGSTFIPNRSRTISAPAEKSMDKSKSRKQLLESLERRFCRVFPLSDSLADANAPVFGEGASDADLMFVGEAPGADEDREGRPFVGAAGKKLNDMISAMGYSREEVYIANILKARPPGNRAPLPDEIADHSPFLVEQLQIIQPRVVVALGRPAAHFLLGTTEPISRLRGIWGKWDHEGLSIDVMPTFHPAYLLRQYTPEVRAQVWSDMQQVMAKLQ